jgi:hypothetical protein
MKIITVYKRLSLNAALLLAAWSILFCWFTGILPLYAGILSVMKALELRRLQLHWTPQGSFKLKWTFNLSIIGVSFSLFFCLYYLTALLTGAFISL